MTDIAQVPQRLVRSTVVVPADPVGHRAARRREARKLMLPHALFFETSEEPLDDPVLHAERRNSQPDLGSGRPEERIYSPEAGGYQDPRRAINPAVALAELEETFRDLARTRALRDPRVFLRDGKPILDVDGAFQAACREAKITNFRVHDFRHTAITNMRRAGIDQLTIMKLPATRRWSASPGTTASVSQTCKAAARQFNTYLTLAHQTASAVASDQLKELSVTA